MSDSFIIDGARSPIGTKNGQMVGVRSDDLSAQVIKGLMERNTNIPSEAIEDVVVGCAFPEGRERYRRGREPGREAEGRGLCVSGDVAS